MKVSELKELLPKLRKVLEIISYVGIARDFIEWIRVLSSRNVLELEFLKIYSYVLLCVVRCEFG